MSSLPSIQRGDVYYADLNPVIGSEQGGIRPVLIIQNDVGNHYSPTTIVAAITGKTGKTEMPTHVPVPPGSTCLAQDSVVLAEQIRTIDKSRLKKKVCHLDDGIMAIIDDAIKVSLGYNIKNEL